MIKLQTHTFKYKSCHQTRHLLYTVYIVYMSHFSYACKTKGENRISRSISALCVNCLSAIPEYSKIIDHSIFYFLLSLQQSTWRMIIISDYRSTSQVFFSWCNQLKVRCMRCIDYVTLELFLNRAEPSLNSGNLKITEVWIRLRLDPVSLMGLVGIVVASWSLTQEVAGSSPFTGMTNIFVAEFTEFSEKIEKNSTGRPLFVYVPVAFVPTSAA